MFNSTWNTESLYRFYYCCIHPDSKVDSLIIWFLHCGFPLTLSVESAKHDSNVKLQVFGRHYYVLDAPEHTGLTGPRRSFMLLSSSSS